jgi:methyl-accepting chemotaxis protein
MIAIGLLLLASVIGMAARVALISSAEDAGLERQEANMRVAWDVLRQSGNEFHLKNGLLYAGSTAVNGSNEAVDHIRALVGGAATIFAGDIRVATNVQTSSGERALGTKLAPGPVYEAVLTHGQGYRGETTILGTPYFAAYDPIKDASGQTVGILFVGCPKSLFLSSVWITLKQLAFVATAAAAVMIGGCLLLIRKLFQPLKGLHSSMLALADGRTDIDLPGLQRDDEIGSIARAVQSIQRHTAETARLEALSVEKRRREAETEQRQRAEAEATFAAAQAHVVGSLAQGLERLSARDLSVQLNDPFAHEYEKLRTDFNTAVSKLKDTIKVVASNTGLISSGSIEISTAAQDLSHRTEQQAASLEQTAAALDQIAATVRKTAEGAINARDVVGSAKSDANKGGEVARLAISAMNEIEQSSQKISQIIGVIDEIAFQTNLLALNAGVEAARAGDSGRGFAVVAAEVRALAQRSAGAAKDIKSLISSSNVQVERGVSLVAETGEALDRIVNQVSHIDKVVSEIASSAQEQATGIREINVAVNQMDQVTQQNAAMVGQTTAASQSLAHESAELARLIGDFRVGSDAPEGARAPALPRSRRVA